MKPATLTRESIVAFAVVLAGVPIARADRLPLPPGEARTSEASAGWQKLEANPVLGGDLGTCFDVCVLREDDKFRMWFSWRPKDSIALVESRDGVHWNEPTVVLRPNPKTDWEERINRPVVLKRDGVYHMWYTGQTRDRSWIGYATSRDGTNWNRMSPQPVLSAEPGWEKEIAVMCPHVLWDDREQLYRMWYSGGEQYEPNAIGYATSPDGMQWTKHPDNPIFDCRTRTAPGNSTRSRPAR